MATRSCSSRHLLSRFIRFVIGPDVWEPYHFVVFCLTFVSYALVHASRKTLSTVKSSLIAEWTNKGAFLEPLFEDNQSAESFLAFLDGAFLTAYAVGLYLGGTLGDRYNPSKVLAVGMWTSAITVFFFGSLSKWLMLHSTVYYATTWIACAFFQSVVWPAEVDLVLSFTAFLKDKICIMGSWFGHHSRGAVLGLWSSCASVGNILGTLISSKTVQLGYEFSFAANSSCLFIGGFFVFFLLLPAPLQHGHSSSTPLVSTRDRPEAINFWQAWLLPGVIAYSLAYACLKLVNYSFFFWLPFYLHAHFGWKESVADELSAWYDIGGIVAAVIAGVASDHFSSRTPILVSMLIMSMGALFFYANSPNDFLINSFLMALTGFFVGGPSNLISSAVSADLGKAEQIHGSAEALSTVTGIIDGTGSVGAGIGQFLIPKVEQHFGWIAVFYGFIFMMFCTVLCLVPPLLKEMLSRGQHYYSALSARISDEENTTSDADISPVIPVRHIYG